MDMAVGRASCWLLIPLLLLLLPSASAGGRGGGLFVVVTFPGLAQDVGLLVCEDDYVVSLVPPGVDPHEYQLRPGDLRLLEDADLIISTGHTPFEARIRELVEAGELGGVLVEVPSIPGIRLLENPATGQPNYHMPIYDPLNYVRFVEYVSGLLADMRPSRAGDYEEKAEEVVRTVGEMVEEAPELGLRAVADMPVVPYAVSWLGVDVAYVMLKEPCVPATPGELMEVEEAMAEGEVGLAVVCYPVATSSSEQLEDMAREHGIPVLYVPSPMSQGSIPDKLSEVLEGARALSTPEVGGATSLGPLALTLASALLVAATLAVVKEYAGR